MTGSNYKCVLCRIKYLYSYVSASHKLNLDKTEYINLSVILEIRVRIEIDLSLVKTEYYSYSLNIRLTYSHVLQKSKFLIKISVLTLIKNCEKTEFSFKKLNNRQHRLALKATDQH